MIKFIKNFCLLVLFSLLLFVFLSNPKLIIDSVNYSVQVFLTNVLPSLYPFFILADFLINYGYVSFLNSIFKFKYGYLILMSLFSGLPSNAKYISNLLSNNYISLRDANIMLSVTFFPNPMFVIGSIGTIMLGDVKTGMFILFSVYLSNFILYLWYYRTLENNKIDFAKNKKSFTVLLKDSVLGNAKTLVIILGTIVIFTTLSNIIFNYFDAPPIFQSTLTAIFEMTSGVKKMSMLDSTHLRIILISLALCFSGISVLCQALSILSDYKLDIKLILKNKFIIMILNFFINYFYVVFFM